MAGVALLPRLYVAFRYAPAPVWDGYYYQIGAESIAHGAGYVGHNGKPWCHYPVGYSAFLGAVYAVLGTTNPVVGKVAGAIVGSLLAVLTYALARRATTDRRASAAGLTVALYPGLVAYAPLHMAEPLAATLVVAAVWCAVRAAGDRRHAMAAGILFGLATLVRPQSILLAPVAGWPLQAGDTSWRTRIGTGLVTTAIALATVLPWSVRNCRVMDDCSFVSTNGGWNLAIGSFPRATGRFETLRSGDGCHIVTGQVQQDRCWARLGVGWIRADPWRWVHLIDEKLGFTFDHESFPIGYLDRAEPERFTEAERARGRGILSQFHRLLLLLATLAVFPAPRRSRPLTLLLPTAFLLYGWYAAWTWPHTFWPLTLLMVAVGVGRWRALTAPVRWGVIVTGSLVVIHAVFFGEDRYHLIATPFWALMAASWGAPSVPASPREETTREEAAVA
ncbi:MAG: glycosyltransferase family 39 protein [Myxococcota bacterium]